MLSQQMSRWIGGPGLKGLVRIGRAAGVLLVLAGLTAIGARFWQSPGSVEQVTTAGQYQGAVDRFDSREWTVIWQSDDQVLRLKANTDREDGWVCPVIKRQTQQPFCRRFSAAVVGACQRDGALQIVLADGDIHQVDHALIGTVGSFAPAHHRARPLALRDAWFPDGACGTSTAMAQVVAMDGSGGLMLFDGATWREISSGLRGAGVGAH